MEGRGCRTPEPSYRAEVTLVHQNELRIVAVERAHRRVFVLDPGQIAAAVRVRCPQSVRYPLDRRAECGIDVGYANRRRHESVVVGRQLNACGSKLGNGVPY